MTSSNQKGTYSSPEVYYISDKDQLLPYIEEEIREKKCKVFSFTGDTSLKRLSSHLQRNAMSRTSYFLVALNAVTKKDVRKKDEYIEGLLNIIANRGVKTIFVFPYTYPSYTGTFYLTWERRILESRKAYAGVVYLGDILTSIKEKTIHSELDSILKNIREGKRMSGLDQRTSFNPMSIETAAKGLVSLLFSMSAYKTTTALLGPAVTVNDIVSLYPIDKRKSFFSGTMRSDIKHPGSIKETRLTGEDVQKLLLHYQQTNVVVGEFKKKTDNFLVFNKFIGSIKGVFDASKRRFKNLIYKGILNWRKISFSNKKQNTNLAKAGLQRSQKSSSDSLKKLFKAAIFIFLLTAFIPVIFLSFSKAQFLLSDYLLKKSYVAQSRSVLQFTKVELDITRKVSLLFLKTPAAGRFYEDIYLESNILIKVVDLQMNYRDVFKDIASFIIGMGKNGSGGNNSERIGAISLEIENIYSNTGFLEGEWKKENNGKTFFQDFLFPHLNASDTRSKILLFDRILKQGEELVGVDKPKNYLLLFQDNSEIRPTGGKIKAFGVLTLSNAEITNIRIFNLEDPNEKILGQVAPPEPLKKYFKKDYWYLEDSNWYVDFPASAEKSEWFLDKGLDISVDGVISLDTTAVYELSGVMYKESLDLGADTVREDLATFLSDMFTQKTRTTYDLIYKWLDLLNAKHILIFSHNNNVRKTLNELGWDGSIKEADCSSGCYLDTIGLVESAGGYGTENVKKDLNIKVSIEEGIAKKTLTVYMENNNDFAYKSYTRIVANSSSGFSPVVITTQDDELQEYPEIYGSGGYKEAGLFLEFDPHETKAITFSWENEIQDFKDMSRYVVLIRKQPGEKSYPISLSLRSLARGIERITPPYSLTSDGVWSYNTDLLNDFESAFFWK